MRKLMNIALCASAWAGGLILAVYIMLSPTGMDPLAALLPILYALGTSVLLLYKDIWACRYRFTVYAVVLLQWLRCVFLPVAGVLCGVYTDILRSDNAPLILGLMFSELVLLYAVCFLLVQKKALQETPCLRFHGTYALYILFALAALGLYLVFARGEQLFSFIFLDTSTRVGDETNSRITMIRTVVSTAMTFLALSAIYRFHVHHTRTNRPRYAVYAVVLACVMLCIIVGERRSRQVYQLFAYAFILCGLFPRYRKRLVYALAAVAGSVLVFMSIYKFFAAFAYGSYWDALRNANSSLSSIVRTVDSYFYGFAVLNRNLNYAAANTLPMRQLFLDIGRNIFGVHYLFRGVYTTTEIYNLYWYAGARTTGYLLSCVGYGWLFLGALAPLITLFNLLCAAFFENRMTAARSLEWRFAFGLMFMRFAFGLFGAPPAHLNSTSQTFIIYGIVILCSGILVRRTEARHTQTKKDP